MEVMKGKVGMPRGLVVGSLAEKEELEVGFWSELVLVMDQKKKEMRMKLWSSP